MRLLDKNLTEIDDNLDRTLDKNVIINKKINGINTLNLTAYSTFYTQLYNDIVEKNIIEVEGDLYVIDNIREMKENKGAPKKIITASQIVSELKTQYWENTFAVINPIVWQPNERITNGLFYIYNNTFYLCIQSHISEASFDITYFNDVSGVEDNYMPDTTPLSVLNRLLANTSWVVQAGDTFTSTDFYLQKGSLYSNLNNIIKTWGGEFEILGRTISLKTRIGEDKTDEFNSNNNLERLVITKDSSNIINKLYVYGSSGLTLENLTGQKYVEDTGSITQYGERVGEVIFNTIIDESFLLQRANEELLKKKEPNKTIDTKALRLDGQTFNIGDTIKLVDTDFNENLTDYRIYSISYNPITGKVFDCSLGSTRLSITSILKEIIEDYDEKDSNLNDKIDNIQNDDAIINQVIDVVQYQTINVENAHILNAWISNLYVERGETNSWGRDIRNPDLTGLEAERNYIIFEDQHLTFITETLDLTVVESLQIPNPNQAVTGLVNVYYTAIGTHQDAYKYYTTTKPSILNPDIDPVDDPLYEVKVYAVKEVGGVKQSLEKLNFTFTDDGSNNIIITLGAGDGITDLSNRFQMFKGVDYTSLYFYDASGSDLPNGFKLNLSHVEVKNANPPVGGGHVSNVFYGTADPTGAIGEDGDVYFKLQP